VLPHGVDAVVELGSWPVPPLFRLVRDVATGLDDRELHRTLNMGIGMVVVCSDRDAETVRAAIHEESWVIGELMSGQGAVRLT
jgi:phosphoribosylaminoimidazole (AIR) synthetase